MDQNSETKFESFISLSEASRETGYHPDYLGFLCRNGKLKGLKIGRNWVTTRDALDDFIKNYRNGISEVVDEGGTKIPVHVSKNPGSDNGVQGLSISGTDNADSKLNSPAEPVFELAHLKKEVLSEIDRKVKNLQSDVLIVEDKLSLQEFKLEEREKQLEEKLIALATEPKPQDGGIIVPLPREHLHGKFVSNLEISAADKTEPELPASRNAVHVAGPDIKKLYSSFSAKPKFTRVSLALVSGIALIGFFASVLWSNFHRELQLDRETKIIYQSKGGVNLVLPSSSPSSLADNNGAGSAVVIREKNVTKYLGPDQAALDRLLTDKLNQYLAEGKFTGPKGDKGDAGTSSGLQGSNSPVLAVYQPIPSSGFSGGTGFSSTQLSAASAVLQVANIGELSVTGSASFAGPTTLNGATTISNLTVGNINPGFTQGSVVFQGGSGLSQDNANFFYNSTTSQLSLGTTTPNSSAILEVDSTSKGFLAPRMTTAQRDAIVSPAAGLLIFNTTTNQYNNYNGTVWGAIAGSGSGTSTWDSLQNPVADLNLNFTSTTAATTYKTTFTYGTGTGSSNLFNLTDTANNNGTGTLFTLTSGNGSALNPFSITASSVPALYVTSSARVGVGTTTPQTKLAIQGAAGSTDLLDIASSTGSSVLRVTSAGNVGIGTTTPSVPLVVVGSTTITSLSAALPVRSTAAGALFNGAVVLNSSDVSGVLPIANGGTNTTTLPVAGTVAYGDGNGYAFTGLGTTFQVLKSSGSGAPVFADIGSLLTAGSNIVLSGTSTIAVSATPSFTSLTLTNPLAVSSGGIGTTTLGSLTVGSNLNISGGQSVLIGTSTSISLGAGVIVNVSTGTAGNIFNITTSTNALVINMPTASITNSGQLASSDFLTFNNKLSGSLTSGQVVYATAASTTASSANFLWGNTAQTLTLNSSTPAATLALTASSSAQTLPIFQISSTTGSSLFQVSTLGNVNVATLTSGSILFAGANGLINQSNSHFYWDNTNTRLGVGTSSPVATLSLQGTAGQTANLLDIASSTSVSMVSVSSSGALTVQPAVNIASAFAVKNSAGTNIFQVDTTDQGVGVMFEVASSSGASFFDVLGNGFAGINSSSPIGTFSIVGQAGVSPSFVVASSSGSIIFQATALGNINVATLTASSLVVSDGSKNLSSLGQGTYYQVLRSSGTALPAFDDIKNLLTAGTGITLSGTSTIAVSSSVIFNVSTGTAGNIFNISTSTNALVINMPTASITNTGQLQGSDFLTFNNKLSATNGADGYIVRFIGATTTATSTLIDNGTVAGMNASSSSVSFLVQGTTTLNPFQINTSTGAAILTVTAAGSFGINSSTPQATLVVQGTTTQPSLDIFRLSSSSNATVLQVDNLGQANFTGNFVPSSGFTAFYQLQNAPTINQGVTATGITRGEYINPTITKAYDFRALEVAGYTFNINSATPPSVLYGSLFNAPRIATTGATTITSARTLTITGAVISSDNNTTITSSTALTIQGGSIKNPNTGQGIVTNAYSLFVQTPTGATNNYAAVFTGGNVGVGSTTPSATLSVLGPNASSGIAQSVLVVQGGVGGSGASGSLISLLTGTGGNKVTGTGGPGGTFSILSGNGGTGLAGGSGGVINITAGNGGDSTGTAGNGGNIVINPGAGGTGDVGNGSFGNIILANLQGYVGIGTSTPAAKLDVYGSGTVNPFNVSSSSNASLFTITAGGNVNVATLTASSLVVTDASKNLASSNITVNNIISNVSTGTAGNIFNISTSTNALVINMPTASITNTGQLQGSDFLTFNNKLSGSGTANYLTKFSAPSTTVNSLLYDDGTYLSINSTTATALLTVQGSSTLPTTNIFTVSSSSNSQILTVTAGGNVNIATLTATSLLASDANKNLQSIIIATNTSGSLFTLGLSGSALTLSIPNSSILNTGNLTASDFLTFNNKLSATNGANGYAVRFTGATTTATSTLIDNGTVAGMNASSSSVSFLVQGTTTLNPFQINSSTGASILVVTPAGSIGINSSTPQATLVVQGTTTQPSLDIFRVASSSNATVLQVDNLGQANFTGSFTPSSGSTAFYQLQNAPTINQNPGVTGITRGIYVNPTLSNAYDFRSLEIAAFTATTNQTTLINNVLIGQPTYATTAPLGFPAVTLANAQNVTIGGAPITTQKLTIGSSTALTIKSGSNVRGDNNGNVNNAYSLYVETPTGAANNFAAVFTGGSVGIGSTSPTSATLALQGTAGSTDIFRVASSTGTIALDVNPAGLVGINTVSPTASLFITGSGGNNALVVASSTGAAVLTVDNQEQVTLAGDINSLSGASTFNSFQITNNINQGAGATGITRALYLTPSASNGAYDHRAFELATYNYQLSTTSPPSTLYNALFNAPTILTPGASNATATNAQTLTIIGAPIARSLFANMNIASSTALTIKGASVVSTGGTVTNAYGLWTEAPTGATNNYAAIFTGGNVGIGSTSPTTATLALQGSSAQATQDILRVASSSLSTLFSVTAAGNVNIATLTANSLVTTDASKNLQSNTAITINNIIQNVSTGTAGNIFNISTSTNALVINMPTASITNTGQLQGSDFLTFNNKLSGSGTANYLTKFTGPSTTVNSLLYDDGTYLSINSTTATALLTVQGSSTLPTTNIFTVSSSSNTQILTVTAGGNVNIATLTATSLLASDANKNLQSIIIATNTSGSLFTLGLSGSALTLSIPNSSILNTGNLTSTDWATFNNKLSGSLTSGQVVYATAASTTASSANFLWGNTAQTLTLNSSTPAATLALTASSSAQTLPIFQISSTTGSSFLKVAVNGSTTLSSLATSGVVRSVGGELNIGAVNLASGDITGTLGIVNGGTGTTTAGSAGTVAYYDGSTLRSTLGGTAFQVLRSNGSSAPAFDDIKNLLTAGVGVSLSGTSTIAIASGVVNNVSTGTAGNIFNITTTTNALVINMPTANITNSGQLASADWLTFNNKLSATNGANGYLVRFTGATTTATSTLIDNGTVAGMNASSSSVSFLVQGTTTLNPFQINSSTGATILTVTPGGNFGINSSTPGATLVVQGTTTQPSLDIFRVASSTNDTYLVVTNTGRIGIGTSSPVMSGLVTIGGSLTTASTSGINFGGDPTANLYRSAAGTIKTDGILSVNGNTIASTSMTAVAGQALILSGGTTGNVAGADMKIIHTGTSGLGSGTRQALTISNGAFLPTTGSAVFNLLETQAVINQTAAANGITRGEYINPTLTTAADFRALEVAGYNYNLAASVATNATLYGSLFNAYNIASGSPATLTSVSLITLTGAPTASTTGVNTLSISSSTALTILGNNVTASTTNSYGLWLNANSGATNNYAAIFTGGNVGIGSTAPSTTLAIKGSAAVDPFDVSSSTNTSILRVTALGNVGIGTTTPGNALTVIGSISSSNLTSGNCVQAGAGGVLTSAAGACGTGGSGNSAFTIGNGLIYNATSTDSVLIGTSATNTPVTFMIQGSGSNNIFQITTSTGAEILRVTAAGNIGINSSTPNATLVVQGTTTQPSLDIFRVATSTGQTYLSVNNVGQVQIGTTTNATALLNLGGTTVAANGINFGDSTANLYRSSAGMIKTDGNLTLVGGGITAGTNMSLTAGSGGTITLSSGASNTAVNAVVVGNNANPMTWTSGNGGQYSVGTVSSAYAPASGSGTFYNMQLISGINQNPSATGITRGLYINPTLTNAYDFRGLETAAYTATTNQTTLLNNILFGQPTYGTTSAASNLTTLTNAQNLVVSGAPIAGGQGSTGLTISSSTALYIKGSAVTSGNGTTTNAQSLYVEAPTGATNNYAALFMGGSVGFGTSTIGANTKVDVAYLTNNELSGTQTGVDSRFIYSAAQTSGYSINIYGFNGRPTVNGALGNSGASDYIYGVNGAPTFSGSMADTGETVELYGLAGQPVFSGTIGGNSDLVELQGVYGDVTSNLGTTGSTAKYGGLFQATGSADVNYGVHASASGATTNYGIYSDAGTNYFASFTGVGTTTPAATLSIVSSSSTLPTAVITATSGQISNLLVVASSSGTSYLTINSSGNVGIGTSTPGNALTVIGSISSSNLTSGNCVQAGAGGVLTSAAGACGSGGSGNSAWTIGLGQIYNATSTDTVIIGATATNTPVTFMIQGSGTNSIFQITSSTGAEILRVTAAGNIGINSTTPNATLVVQGTTTQPSLDIFRVATSSGQTYLSVNNIGQVQIGTTTNATALLNLGGTTVAANGINFGDSTANLYRSAAGTIKTDGTININGTTYDSTSIVSGSNMTIKGSTNAASFQVKLQGNSAQTYTSGTGQVTLTTGTFSPTSGTGVWNTTEIQGTITQTPGATGITRGLYTNPTLTNAYDFRSLETAAYTATTNQTTLLNNILFGQPTYGTTSAASNLTTLTNAQNLVVSGAPIAGGQGSTGLTISSSTALYIKGSAVTSGNGTTTNAQSLYVEAPTGATNNYAAIFTGGNVGIGTTAPNVLLTIGAASTTAGAGLNFGGDTTANLYRTGAGTIKTDGSTLSVGATNYNTTSLSEGSAINYAFNCNLGSGTTGACWTFKDVNSGSRSVTSGTNQELLIKDGYAPSSGSGTYTWLEIQGTVNQNPAATGITRGIYVNQTLTNAKDFRALETAAFTATTNQTTLLNNVLINQPTYATTSAASNLTTLTNAQNVTIQGAPIAGTINGGANGLTISSSTALYIKGSAVTSGNGTTTNAQSLYVEAPTGATNNYAAVFTGGNVGVGSTGPVGLFSLQNAASGTNSYAQYIGASTGSATNNYGLYIADQTVGTNDWNIYSGPAISTFTSYANPFLTGAANVFAVASTSANVNSVDIIAEGVNPTALYALANTTGGTNGAEGIFAYAANSGTTTLSGVPTAAISAEVDNTGSGTIVSGIGLDIYPSTNTGGGVITNNYGIRVQDQTAGTNNYAIVTGAGKSGFGSTTPTATLVVQGTSSSPSLDVLNIASSTGSSLLIVKSVGNVGIGTTTPGNALTVIGSISSSNLTSGNCVQAGAGGVLTSASGACGSGTGSSQWTLGSGLIYNATSTDLVGIGTSTPAAKLDVYGSGATTDPFNVSSSSNVSILRVTAGGKVGIGTTTPGDTFSVVGAASTNIMQAYDSSAVSRFLINSSGYVGIGSTSPNSLLAIQGSSAGTANLLTVATSTNLSVFTVKASGDILVTSAINSATAFVINNSSNNAVFTVDASTPAATDNLFTVASSTGTTLFAVNGLGIVTMATSASTTIAGNLSSDGQFTIGDDGLTGTTDGRIWIRSRATTFRFNSTSNVADYSEFFYQLSTTTPDVGTVITSDLSTSSPVIDAGLARISTSSYDSNLLGVVTNRGTGYNNPNDDRQFGGHYVNVGMLGHIIVKVTNENGDIHSGDFLTSSAQFPGYAMKATRSGKVIGQALADFAGDPSASSEASGGQVLTLVKPGYEIINNTFVLGENDGQLAGATSTFAIISSASGSGASLLVNQQGTGNILQLQAGGADRLLIANDGSINILANATSTDAVILAVKNLDTSMFSISAAGHITVGKDTAGTAVIKAGDNVSQVTFETPYASVPKVVASLNEIPNFFYGVATKTPEGFTIQISAPQDHDISFDWIALAQPATTTSVSASAAITAITTTTSTPLASYVVGPGGDWVLAGSFVTDTASTTASSTPVTSDTSGSSSSTPTSTSVDTSSSTPISAATDTAVSLAP